MVQVNWGGEGSEAALVPRAGDGSGWRRKEKNRPDKVMKEGAQRLAAALLLELCKGEEWRWKRW